MDNQLNQTHMKFMLDNVLVIRDNGQTLGDMFTDSDRVTYVLGAGFICKHGWVRPVLGVYNDPDPIQVVVLFKESKNNEIRNR